MHRRWLLAVLVVLVVLLSMHAGLAVAQEQPERILVDTELWMGQGAEQHLCFIVPPGEIAVTGSISRALILPTTVTLRVYSLTGAMIARDGDGVEMILSAEQQTVRTMLAGGPYCWAVETSSFAHNTGEPSIALRITHRVH